MNVASDIPLAITA